ncbi:hypothetical protein Acsp02_81050 [Actinoplanes sp. NBRC 103695]|nr:hypothetical protein Acsp02_81050 [Actinoplanes sp. NBRC 103695]
MVPARLPGRRRLTSPDATSFVPSILAGRIANCVDAVIGFGTHIDALLTPAGSGGRLNCGGRPGGCRLVAWRLLISKTGPAGPQKTDDRDAVRAARAVLAAGRWPSIFSNP